jgi:hypothetical protein
MISPGRGQGRPTQAPRSWQNNEDGGTRRALSRGQARGTRRRRSPSKEHQVQQQQQSTNGDVQRLGDVNARAALLARHSVAQVRNIIADIRRALAVDIARQLFSNTMTMTTILIHTQRLAVSVERPL